MVFVVDDLLYGVAISPWVFVIEQLRNHALREAYPLDKINNQLKENRMLFELGEIIKEAYETINNRLLEKREIAKRVWEKAGRAELPIFPKLGLFG